ncbi:hypothetical protein BV25DRAFT_360361 [Artomyces pyxidatus]|uniref:Uncharacterized protein n=1 Tax=Artomyces pyxidatus TaxID=48021 RepID=A0ACB8T4Y8_9AGAM|nr:hypothetical protein BV25DRAFT_360361 [Artomyces pyxidatus]
MPLNDDLDMPLSLFSSESRQLRSISLHNCSLHWDSTHLPNLVHLHVSSSRPMTPINPIPTAQQLSHMFHGLPQLESLELIDVLRGDPRITPGLQDPIVLPSLTRLKLDFVSPHWSEFIASITAPSLVNSYITFTALPRTLSSSLMHFGKHLRIPRALSVELVPESETPTISEPPNFDCGLRISSAPDAHSWLLLPLGENDPVRAVDAVMDQLWRGLDFSHLRTLSLSFRAHEAWSPERWTAVFGDARGVTGVTAVGRCAADSLTDALATRRPDVLFPALARVELSGSARETDVLAGALRRALRARGERTLQSVCGPGPAEHTDSWTVRTVWTGAIIAERSSQPVLQAEL